MPSSLPADKNFGGIVEGEVIIVVFKSCGILLVARLCWQDNFYSKNESIPMHATRETTNENGGTAR